MCGICGIVNLDPTRPVPPGRIEAMADALAHRGPDDSGYYVDGPVALGHRRLSIIDLGGGRQPIYNEDGSAVIVFNGEVYNYRDLTAELTAHGHVFHTHSDTEAILHSYEDLGDECVGRLRGMFAFAIWDSRLKRLMLARDRLGKKPLYYYVGNGFLAFASEIKALLALPEIPRLVDPEALDLYLSLRYVPGPRTMFRQIFKLQAGHSLILDRAGLRVRKYWDLEFQEPAARSQSSCVEEFRALLEESVRLRLISDVPLGVFLSGGLDSSAILATMHKITGGARIKTFSVGYDIDGAAGEETNEFSYARMAASAFGADHHEFRLKVGDFRDFLPDLVWHLDEPLADPSCIPLYFISKLAREHVTVVLSGEGADEVLAGYHIYQKMLTLETWRRRLGPLATGLSSALGTLATSETSRYRWRMAGLPLESRYHGVSRGLRPDLKRRLLGGDSFFPSADLPQELYSDCFRQASGASPLNRMLYVDTKIWLPEDILMKGDKMTMANSLELRVPFLDHRLVEFAAALPGQAKLHQGTGKALLREAMRGVVPEAILRRPKKGFPVPTQPWLQGQLKAFTRETLLAADSACLSYFNRQALEQMVREHESGEVNREQEIWTLLIFEFWHKVFLEHRAISELRTGERAVAMAS